MRRPTRTVNILFGRWMVSFISQTSLLASMSSFTNALGDFNGDGSIDVAAISFAEGRVYVYLSNAAGVFWEPFISDADSTPQLTVADFNVDGKLDLARCQ